MCQNVNMVSRFFWQFFFEWDNHPSNELRGSKSSRDSTIIMCVVVVIHPSFLPVRHMRLYTKHAKMSWANLTKKLSRSRSHSTWSIKSNKSPPTLNEDAVSQISSVIGILISTPWATFACIAQSLQVFPIMFFTAKWISLSLQVELCPRTTRLPDTAYNGPKRWSPSPHHTLKAPQWSKDKWKSWRSPITAENTSFSSSIPSPLLSFVPRRFWPSISSGVLQVTDGK